RWLGDDAFWDPKVGADPIIRNQDTLLNPGDPITDEDVFPLLHGG
ncbi:MAG: phytanoyl-CoA dioxygenase, partial [Acidimicrobiaceae bacterium]|nr:phytanoyl-CoA dioxygenase [Acidimicrobiaceae bacterium]